jgi:hypothetical protein
MLGIKEFNDLSMLKIKLEFINITIKIKIINDNKLVNIGFLLAFLLVFELFEFISGLA